jgi:hypothetical protein
VKAEFLNTIGVYSQAGYYVRRNATTLLQNKQFEHRECIACPLSNSRASRQRTKFLGMRSSFVASRTPFSGCKQASFPHATSQHPAVHPLKIYTSSLLRYANAAPWAGYIWRELHIVHNRRASEKQCCVTRITTVPNIQQTLSCRPAIRGFVHTGHKPYTVIGFLAIGLRDHKHRLWLTQ